MVAVSSGRSAGQELGAGGAGVLDLPVKVLQQVVMALNDPVDLQHMRLTCKTLWQAAAYTPKRGIEGSRITDLPSLVLEQLDARDLQQLRLTCKKICVLATYELQRVSDLWICGRTLRRQCQLSSNYLLADAFKLTVPRVRCRKLDVSDIITTDALPFVAQLVRRLAPIELHTKASSWQRGGNLEHMLRLNPQLKSLCMGEVISELLGDLSPLSQLEHLSLCPVSGFLGNKTALQPLSVLSNLRVLDVTLSYRTLSDILTALTSLTSLRSLTVRDRLIQTNLYTRVSIPCFKFLTWMVLHPRAVGPIIRELRRTLMSGAAIGRCLAPLHFLTFLKISMDTPLLPSNDMQELSSLTGLTSLVLDCKCSQTFQKRELLELHGDTMRVLGTSLTQLRLLKLNEVRFGLDRPNATQHAPMFPALQQFVLLAYNRAWSLKECWGWEFSVRPDIAMAGSLCNLLEARLPALKRLELSGVYFTSNVAKALMHCPALRMLRIRDIMVRNPSSMSKEVCERLGLKCSSSASDWCGKLLAPLQEHPTLTCVHVSCELPLEEEVLKISLRHHDKTIVPKKLICDFLPVSTFWRLKSYYNKMPGLDCDYALTPSR